MTVNKNHVIAALSVIIFIDEVVIGQINKRKFASLKRQNAKLNDLLTYHAVMLDRHQVPITEFDRVAMRSISE